MSQSLLTPTQAVVPEALDAFQRRPEKAPAYPWWTRWSDRHAGHADGRHLKDAPGLHEASRPARGPVAETAWLVRLVCERDSAIGQEHRSTDALIAVLDDSIAREQSHLDELVTQLEAARSHADQTRQAGPDQGRLGEAEQYGTEEEITARRAREHHTALAGAHSQVEALEAAIATSRASLAALDAAVRSHQNLLTIRCTQLADHYARRAGTYVRALNRASRTPYQVPAPALPATITA